MGAQKPVGWINWKRNATCLEDPKQGPYSPILHPYQHYAQW